MSSHQNRHQALKAALSNRILVLDGAMGTMVQGYQLDEAGYRGARFADWGQDIKGNTDVLNLSRPEIVREIHDAYLVAGADIIETNTFSSTSIAQADYGMEDLAFEMNKEGARVAREAADAATTDDRARFVAGALGPTNRTASISPDVNRPDFRNVDFDELVTSYKEATRGLIEGGADILLIETIFDTLNAKAAIFAAQAVLEENGKDVPIVLSGTITDLSGRTLSGQTTEAFWNSVRHSDPLAVGLNCALGADQLRQYVAELSRVADTLVSAHPNAGLPNEFGEYDETPEAMAGMLKEWAESGLVNIIGGCCGTTPAHITAIANAVNGLPPRKVPAHDPAMRLSGLEPFRLAS